jgi:transmembrane sensor
MDPWTIIAAFSGEASEDELRELAEWRADDPRHEREYRRLARLWLAGGEASEVPERFARPPAVEDIIERAEREPRDVPSHGGDSPVGSSLDWRRGLGQWTRRAAGIAAVLLLGLSVGLWIRNEPPMPFGPEALVTGDNEVATVTLQDQTVVRLAPSSRLTFSSDRSVREVSLTGRAYFAVARDESRPFRVRLPQGDIEVLGTRFGVQSGLDDMSVAVVEGSVRVEARGARLDLEANDVARVTSAGAPEVHRVDDPYEAIGWLGGFLAFETTPMWQVAEEFSRRFGTTLAIEDERLRNRSVTGWFADQTPTEMVMGICMVLEAECVVDGAVIRMGPTPTDGRTRAGDSI